MGLRQVPSTDHVAQFAFLNLPGAPVQPLEGWAAISGNEARSPQIEIVNKSAKPVRYVEIGWLVKDKQGREYVAGSVPGSESTMVLPSGQHTRLQQDTALRFSRSGRPIEIDGMTAYVSQVEFADGRVWVPSRRDLDSSPLLRVTAPSPEEQRLADIYAKKGLAALVGELNPVLNELSALSYQPSALEEFQSHPRTKSRTIPSVEATGWLLRIALHGAVNTHA